MTKSSKLVPQLIEALRWNGSGSLYAHTYNANKGEHAILLHREWLWYFLAQGPQDLRGPLHDAEVWGKDKDECKDGPICEGKVLLAET